MIHHSSIPYIFWCLTTQKCHNRVLSLNDIHLWTFDCQATCKFLCLAYHCYAINLHKIARPTMNICLLLYDDFAPILQHILIRRSTNIRQHHLFCPCCKRHYKMNYQSKFLFRDHAINHWSRNLDIWRRRHGSRLRIHQLCHSSSIPRKFLRRRVWICQTHELGYLSIDLCTSRRHTKSVCLGHPVNYRPIHLHI